MGSKVTVGLMLAGLVLAPGLAAAANPPPAAAKPGAAARPPAPAAAPAPAAPGYEISSPAQFMDELFGKVCVPNYDASDRVRAYAAAQHLPQLTSPQAITLYVGQGDGAAWEVRSPLGAFVLSIRGATQGCAVWSKEAAPLAVETYFRSRIPSLVKPGAEAFLDKDAMVPSGPFGNVHAMVFVITQPDAPESVTATMLAADKPGGAYQALMQVARSGRRVPPLVPPRSTTDD